MKTIFKNLAHLSLVVLGSGLASGQYFHHVYGRNQHDLLQTGQNVSYAGAGHLMSGIMRTSAPITGLLVVRTNVEGDIASPENFKRSYRLVDPATGAAMRAVSSQAQEVSSTVKWGQTFYSVTGSCRRSTGQVFPFYLELTKTGAVIPGSAMLLGATNAASTVVTASTLSGTGKELYLCGRARVGSNTWTAVMKLDLTVSPVGVMWSRQYISPRGGNPEYMAPTSLIESPYETSVVVVGGSRSQGGQTDGFIMRLKDSNGNPGPVQLHGSYGTSETFNKISVMDNTVFGQPGFVLTGNIQQFGARRCWVTFTNETGYGVGSRVISNAITSSAGGLTGTDVIERLNVAGDYEYYVMGAGVGTAPERLQMIVNKFSLGGYFHKQFRYGGSGRESGVAIDFENTAGGGLSLYGITRASFPSIGQSDFYCVKSYFNGESGCHQFFNSYQHGNGPGYMHQNDVRQDQAYLPFLITANIEANLSDDEICYANSIGSGDNN